MQSNNLILVGGGGHARSLLLSFGQNVKGYLSPVSNDEMDREWMGDDSVANDLKRDHEFHIAFIYSGQASMKKRRFVIDSYESLRVEFSTLISPSAIIAPGSVIGEGSAVMAGAIVNGGNLGRHVVVNTGAIVEHDCKIGNNVFIGPGAVIGGFTEISDDCFIGLGAKIRNGIKICNDVTIGMGAIVTKDIHEPGTYYNVV